MNEIVELRNIKKSYGEVAVLNEVSLKIYEKEMIAIMGTSGSGKTTLLNIIGLLLSYDEGEYYLKGELVKFSEKKLARIRNKEFGFIVQDFALIEGYTVLENLMLPIHYMPRNLKKRAISKIDVYLKKMGLFEKKRIPVKYLSGGQKQRVAIIRAIICDAEIILADEPTGALDNKNTSSILSILQELNKEGKTIVLVTHDINVAEKCNRILTIDDGVCYSEKE